MSEEVGVRIHEGAVVRLWDHAGLQLRTDSEMLYLSIYEYRFDLESEPGFVASLRSPLLAGPPKILVSDRPPLAEAHKAFRMRNGYPDDGPIRPGTVERVLQRSSAVCRLAWDDHEVVATWEGLGPPQFMIGTHPREKDVAVYGSVREAPRGSATLDGAAIPGDVFPNEAYTSWLGRPLSSAALTLGEALIRLPSS